MYSEPDYSPGRPLPLGATVIDAGIQFAVASPNATAVRLDLFDTPDATLPARTITLDPLYFRTGDVWHVFVAGLSDKQLYGWRVEGPYFPAEGHRFNPNKLLLDPYARAYAGRIDSGHDSLYGFERHTAGLDLAFSTLDSAGRTLKSVALRATDPDTGRLPNTPLSRSVICELHVHSYTAHPSSGVQHPGSYLGLTEKIPHLQRLGVTAVELLPVHMFDAHETVGQDPVTGNKLTNYWGYATLGFFAPEGRFASDPTGPWAGVRAIDEFRQMVRTFHEAGIEVILDVVYNHTGEGNELGPTLCYRGLDNATYYMLDKGRYYRNSSGCGNTLMCSHPIVRHLIIDSLRYWAVEMGVDGFRFDLAPILGRESHGEWIAGEGSLLHEIALDPILRTRKLIAESWDAEGLYKVGLLPDGFVEWNGRFRDDVRRFVRSDPGVTRELGRRIGGSLDIFKKKPVATNSLNFVTCHDGFPLRDLVSYNRKHNLRNGESNRDGANENFSDNCGVEGETDEPITLALRVRQAKNLLTLLFLSRGTPMLLAGDELWRTQAGNNNPWCQDNELSWLDWTPSPESDAFQRFVAGLTALRRRHAAFRREAPVDPTDAPVLDVTWHGIRINEPDLSSQSHTLAVHIRGVVPTLPVDTVDRDLFLVMNAWREPLDFQLPPGHRWVRVLDTSRPAPDDLADEDLAEPEVKLAVPVAAYSTALFVSRTKLAP
jgi:isoamylase